MSGEDDAQLRYAQEALDREQAAALRRLERRRAEDGWAAGLRADGARAARPEPTDEERAERLRQLMGDDGASRITNGADIAAVFRLLEAERLSLTLARNRERLLRDDLQVERERADAAEARLVTAERDGAVRALRSLPDHIVPNMSLVAQIDRRADAIENGADL